MNEIWKTMFDAAKSVMREIHISEYVSAGEVGAAILSKSGKSIPAFAWTPVPRSGSAPNGTPFSI